jgi:hypothetical protein
MDGVAGAGNASCGETDAQRPGHGERDRSRQGGGNDASTDRDLLHLDGFGGRFFLRVFRVAQRVSCGG